MTPVADRHGAYVLGIRTESRVDEIAETAQAGDALRVTPDVRATSRKEALVAADADCGDSIRDGSVEITIERYP